MNDNNWTFPLQIDFEKVTQYINRFEEQKYNNKIIFDLSKTTYIHSSFIGFLIHAKLKIEKEGGILQILISLCRSVF